jgi:DnaJ domain
MPLSDDQLKELKHAYRVLGVPPEASAHSIKQAYRQLVKRWHPDLCEEDTPTHVEATHMVTLINEAYSAIAHAPLRYFDETYSQQVERRSGPTTSTSTNEPIRVNTENIPKTDRLEFWVRFVCGAVAGVFVCLDLIFSAMPDSSSSLSLLALGALGVVLAFGFGAARYGDKFWYSIFRRWWLWP